MRALVQRMHRSKRKPVPRSIAALAWLASASLGLAVAGCSELDMTRLRARIGDSDSQFELGEAYRITDVERACLRWEAGKFRCIAAG